MNDLDRHGVHPDFYNYYCSFPRLREHLRTRIGQAIKPKEQVLTILGGDFNYVPDDRDRVSMNNMKTVGDGIMAKKDTSKT